ncbi:hypothetical protein Tsubulata_000606 [Turnera subulata]|uniref:Uncharacterized protein n=1 Tax=Turnera subulata TaxID=218843 RepID=A0A9Q0GJR5_9ROSI|nr:hypothetical protein Tsubulata_000606 [Turnera subulata]
MRFSRLTIKEAISTTILSRRWRYAWKLHKGFGPEQHLVETHWFAKGRVRESIGIFKGKDATTRQRLAVVYKAVIVADSFENPGVDEESRAEPATVEVYPGDITASGTHIPDLNGVCRYAVWKWSGGSLVNHNVCPATLPGFRCCVQCKYIQVEEKHSPSEIDYKR